MCNTVYVCSHRSAICVVVPGQCVEGPDLLPPLTQLGAGGAKETTDVWSYLQQGTIKVSMLITLRFLTR